MTKDDQTNVKAPENGDDFADTWAAVLIDVFEKLKSNGELPTDESKPGVSGESPCTKPAKSSPLLHDAAAGKQKSLDQYMLGLDLQ